MRLVVGFGARSTATAEDVEALLPPLDGVVVALSTVDSLAGLARQVAARHGWEVVLHTAAALAGVDVPNPSATVAAHAGTASVAEAAALLTARTGAFRAVAVAGVPGGAAAAGTASVAEAAHAGTASVAEAAHAGTASVAEAAHAGTASVAEAAHAGTASVAEAAALLTVRTGPHPAHQPAVDPDAVGGPAVLVVGKRASAVATVAVAALAPAVTVVGIGADGLDSVAPAGRAAIAAGTVLFGSARQLGLVQAGAGARTVAWPSPLVPALPRLLAAHHADRVVVLASGDPMYHGIGTTLVRLLGAEHVHVVPHPSAVSLACARLGWALDDVEVVSAVGRCVDVLRRVLHDGRRVLVLSAGAGTPVQVAEILAAAGFGGSEVTVLESLGGPDERVHHDVTGAGPLNVVAVACSADPGAGVPVVPGLADETYDSDGQLTKREIRAVTLAALGPRPGELLWDVGGGSGSIAVEWLRAHRSCRAVAVERDPVRAGRIDANARALGVPQLSTVLGAAPGALDGLPAPDAIFIGGGFTAAGVFERCWSALRPGGRLVVNAVTVESERLVADLHAAHGGELTRIAVQRAAPVGGFLAWRPMMPVTQWVVNR